MFTWINITLAAALHALNCEALSGPAAIGDIRGKSKYWMAHHGLLISAMTRAWHHYYHSKLRYFQGEFRDMSCQERRWEDWNPRWFGLVELALNPSRIPGEIWNFLNLFFVGYGYCSSYITIVPCVSMMEIVVFSPNGFLGLGLRIKKTKQTQTIRSNHY